jgi:hypothetical protein
MGAWGTGAFENDTALDWTYQLESNPGIEILGTAVKAGLQFLQSNEEMDADTASNVLAAAEVIAALRGKSGCSLPETVEAWIKDKPKAPAELAKGAFLAVSTVRDRSELKELWQESDENEKWLSEVEGLIKRLK